MTNLQLREANAVVRDAEKAMKAHLSACTDCTRATRQRQLTDMCTPGWALYRERRDAREEAAREKHLASQPAPGQDALFDLGEL